MKKNDAKRMSLRYPIKISLRMKLTTLLLIVSLFRIQANTYSQNTKISLDLENVSLEEVFSKIESETEFRFLFKDKNVDLNRIVSINVNKKRINNILDKLLKNTRVIYKIYDNRQVLLSISPQTGKILDDLPDKQIEIQEITITGKVTDADDGNVLLGVSVIVAGTTIGVSTDFDGNYTINIPDDNVSLEFSYLGYKKQIIAVKGQTTVNVALQPDASKLNEVVLVGYGSVRKKDLTGAVVSLGEDEMTIGASTSSAAQMIQGRAAGVEVSANDGEPGQGMNIVIRGVTSISNSNEPLYVVDGFPMAAGVSISPDDIESIDILKDAASAAIYGSRGSAGVVLITTKGGKSGRTEISYDGYTGIQVLNGSLDYLNWGDHARIVNEQYAEGINDGDPWRSAADIAVPNNTDWVDEVTRSALVQSHTIRASGGDDQSHFSLSANYFDQEGLFINSEFTRSSIRLNADRKFGKRTKVGVNMYTSRISSDATGKDPGSRSLSPLYSALVASPGRAAYNEDGTLASTAFSRDTRPFINPVGHFTERINEYSEWRTYSNLYIDYKVQDNLTAKLNLGYDHTAGTNAQYSPAPYSGNFPVGGITESKSTSYLIEGTLDYKLNVSDNHDLSFLLGTSTQYDTRFAFGAFGNTFPTDKTLYYNLGSAENQTVSSHKEDQRISSFFGRANYSYKGKLLLVATIRTDGASQFGENNKWGVFPSVSGAWRISEEEFLSESNLFSDLKLRASYGVTGNNNFSPYTSLARVAASTKLGGEPNTYSFDGVSSSSGLGSDGVFAPNPDLKWETTKMLNLGLDFGLWNNRLFGSVEVYNSDTEDLIIDRPISGPSTGYTFIRANVGSITNRGLEMTLGGNIVDADSFKWTANVNFSMNDNEITELDGDNPIVLSVPRQPYGEVGNEAFRQLITGGKIGDFYGYTYRGVLQEGATYTPQPNTTNAGSALYEDTNIDGIIDAKDRSVIGNANPDFILGFNNHFEIKGFYVDMFWQGVVGNDILNFKAIALDRTFTTKASERYSAANLTGTRPGVDWFVNEYGSYINTEFIEDGSYARLKNLSIGYNINADNIPLFKNINIYVQAQNLITITNYTGFDPEVSYNYNGSQSSVNRGVDDFGFPNYKTYTLGLKLTF